MWPVFYSPIRRLLWAEFVGSLSCSEKFFSGYSGFPLSPKTNISPTRPHKLTALNCIRCINKVSLPLPYAFFLHVGSYMYMYAFVRKKGDIAMLEYSVPPPDIGKMSCLTFYYHMYGPTINTLNVYNGNSTVFSKSGDQGSVWLKAKISLNLQSNVSWIQ